ncbi:hypothetical protein O1611_g9140 [Lasiodiplodia mahajangana]|uniref:Uncharacterized protein n=1 Tax=Lasiodiplodia mahajangana TaxID=1108764 RepID=A0ACC2JAJ8_9PEZI|nr:hypothetical protein O1611_g9140 [Lasiodiplodia mahajangana]
MPIQFIDNSSIDKKKTRTLIRSHVAKGKNLGRTVHRPSRHPKKRQVPASAVSTVESPSNKKPEVQNGKNLESSLTIQRQLQEDLSTSLPFDVSRACRRLFHQFYNLVTVAPYPPELGKAVTPVKGPRIFLQYAFIDEAFFHCIVAMSVAASTSPFITHQETTEAFFHLSRSLRLVNQRLAENGDVALSDTTLAVVIAMTQHERMLGYQNHALIHFEGLQRIITLRGGISTLVSDCPWVAQKAIRADFDFALQLGSPTRYSVEYVPGKTTLDWLRQEYRRAQNQSSDVSLLIACVSGNLQRVFEDISALAWLVNDSAIHGLKIDEYQFHNVILLVGYHLLNLRPLNTPIEATDQLELSLHLGLAALMAIFFLPLSLKTDIALLRSCISSAVMGQGYDDKDGQELLLWLLLTAKISVFRQADEDIWLIPKISQVATQLGLSTWDHVSQTIQKFPWVRDFANGTAQRLWDQIASSLSPPC